MLLESTYWKSLFQSMHSNFGLNWSFCSLRTCHSCPCCSADRKQQEVAHCLSNCVIFPLPHWALCIMVLSSIASHWFVSKQNKTESPETVEEAPGARASYPPSPPHTDSNLEEENMSIARVRSQRDGILFCKLQIYWWSGEDTNDKFSLRRAAAVIFGT